MALNGVKWGTDVVAIRLRQLRRTRGLTQEELADRAGVEQPQISAWEGGRRTPTMDNVIKLARGLEMGVGDLAQELGMLGEPSRLTASSQPGDLPPALVSAMQAMVRDYPELAEKFERNATDDDFPAQIRTLARALGYVVRGWLDEQG